MLDGIELLEHFNRCFRFESHVCEITLCPLDNGIQTFLMNKHKVQQENTVQKIRPLHTRQGRAPLMLYYPRSFPSLGLSIAGDLSNELG